MKITKLEYQKNDPNRVNVFVDDQFATGINADDVLKLNLFKGKEITADERNLILSSGEFGKLFNQVVNFLSFRPRSEWEVRFHFRSADSVNLEKIIQKLKEINQINDEQFTRWFIDQRNTFRPKGKQAIKYELKKKGVDEQIIAAVLSENGQSDSELARLSIAKKRFKSKEQAIRFLASRGFSWDTINGILKEDLPK